MTDKPTLETMVACAARELALRRNVYPKWITKGRMKPEEAEKEIANMEGILACLKGLRILATNGGIRITDHEGQKVQP